MSREDKQVVGYGELMLRLTPTIRGHLLEQTPALDMQFAGAEANVLANLSLLGHRVNFISAIPKNPIGSAAFHFLRKSGIGVANLERTNHRMGTYFVEQGVSLRGGRVTYDRMNSAFVNCRIPEEKWCLYLEDADYFVLSGISPALGPTGRENIQSALSAAKANDVRVVFDLNYRRSLWSSNEARHYYDKILPSVDILFANIGSVTDIFEFEVENSADYRQMTENSIQAGRFLRESGDYQLVGLTQRIQKDAQNHTVGGILMGANEVWESLPLSVQVLDRLGGGDAFVSGVIHGLRRGWNQQKTLDFSTALYAVTQTQYGDINYLNEEEVLFIAEGNTSGYVQR